MRTNTPLTVAADKRPAALLLELCGVLYDDSCWRRWMLQLLTRMGVQTHYAAFFQVWEQEHFSRVCAGEVGYWEAMRDYLRCIGLTGGRVDEACAAGQSRRRQWERAIRPLPGVVKTLAALSRSGVPLAVVAHASFHEQAAAAKLAELGLDSYINGGVHSTSQLGNSGRYNERFARAAQQLALPPHRLAYVGCGRLPLEQAAGDGLACIAFNTDLAALGCPQLESFEELAEMTWAAPQRKAG